ncbi:MAG: hypothetical protein Q9182_001622 [Xanthomendoza sp. 2 TL-2023]
MFCFLVLALYLAALFNWHHKAKEDRLRESMRRYRERVRIEHELGVLRPGFDGADEESGGTSTPQRLQQQASDSHEPGFQPESPRHSLGASTLYHPLSTASDGNEGSGREVDMSNETPMAVDAPVPSTEENSDGDNQPAAAQEQHATAASPIPAPAAGESQSLNEQNNRRKPHERERSSAA